MAQPYSDEQVQGSMDRIASPEKRVTAPDGRTVEFRSTDEDLEQGNPFPPGYCHFPRSSEEYFKQITAEQLVTKLVRGYRRLEWQKMRERNEALDCRVYARAAAARVGLDRYQEKHWHAMEERMGLQHRSVPQPEKTPASALQPPVPRPRGRRVIGRFRT